MKLTKFNLIRLVQSHARLVYLFIGISMLGVVALQGYLVYVVIDWQHTNFEDRVSKALEKVYEEIELEKKGLLKRNLSFLFQQQEAFYSIPDPDMVDSVKRALDTKLAEALSTIHPQPPRPEFAIFSEDSRQLLLSTSPAEVPLDQFDTYTHPLPAFPSQYASEENYLLGLYFPSYNWYIFSLLRQVFLILLVLFFVTLTLFTSTILTIASQEQTLFFRNEFINNLAHELKTPVFAASIIHKIAKKSLINQNYEKLTKQLTLLDMENRDLSKRVERILEYAMIEEGNMPMNFQLTDLDDLLSRCVALYRPIVESQRGRLIYVGPPLPVHLSIDPIQIKNVIHNLLDNALKYSERAPLIHISCEPHGYGCTLYIRDNGKGIPLQNQPFIFEKFYRAPQGDEHNTKGFGLGLAYVKQVVEAHGGRVGLESKAGMGSTFSIMLPLEPKLDQSYVASQSTINGG